MKISLRATLAKLKLLQQFIQASAEVRPERWIRPQGPAEVGQQGSIRIVFMNREPGHQGKRAQVVQTEDELIRVETVRPFAIHRNPRFRGYSVCPDDQYAVVRKNFARLIEHLLSGLEIKVDEDVHAADDLGRRELEFTEIRFDEAEIIGLKIAQVMTDQLVTVFFNGFAGLAIRVLWLQR